MYVLLAIFVWFRIGREQAERNVAGANANPLPLLVLPGARSSGEGVLDFNEVGPMRGETDRASRVNCYRLCDQPGEQVKASPYK